MAKTEKSTSNISQGEKRNYHLPWVAKWLTLWQAILKGLQFVFCVVSIVVLLTWNIGTSIPINFTELVFNDPVYGYQDFRGHWYFYISTIIFSLLYVVFVFAVGFFGFNVWPTVRTFLTLLCTILLLFAAPTLSAALFQMELTRLSQMENVSYITPKVALAFGFAAMILFLVDVLGAFLSLREHRKGKRFISEAASVKTARNPQIAEIAQRETPVVQKRIRSVKEAEDEEPLRYRQTAV